MNNLINFFLMTLALGLGAFTALNAQQSFVLSGHISSATGTKVEAVGSNGVVYTTYTVTGGTYFLEVPAGNDYTIRPYNDQNPLNGVNTWDLVLLTGHISGATPFTNPAQLIAADANNDQIIDLTDTMVFKSVILGSLNSYPNQTSWRFMPRNYSFPDPSQPFEFPDSIVIENLNSNFPNINFNGIKIGDIDFTAAGNYNTFTGATYHGFVRRDDNVNCVADSSELPLAGWMVQAVLGNVTYHAMTDTNGHYILNVPVGAAGYLHPLVPNELWGACDSIPINPSLGGIIQQWLPVTPLADCPRMEVELSTAGLRRCFANNYYVINYCNRGPSVAENAYVELELDSLVYFLESSMNHTVHINGTDTTYRFNLGNVPSNTCGYFLVNVQVSCDAVLGQTHCSSVHIYPDTLCLPGLAAYANLEVEGVCNGEYIIFTITNTGTDMVSPVEYVVIEDIVIQMMSNNIQLANGESTTISVPSNGATWRLEVAQPDGHPWYPWVSAAVEGCGTNTSGSFSLGMITGFPQYTSSPAEDENCTENKGSFDPNDKQGFPKGVGEDHIITRDHPLEYLIRFQNTGTDTAFNVYILDTIAPHFDLATFRFLGSSHPCNVFLQDGVLRLSFNGIMLPDSNVNEPMSHGFVRYAIAPKSSWPDGTILNNRAGIYFDYNEPIITNQTAHTIGSLLVSLPGPGAIFNDLTVEVFPVPATTQLNVHLKSPHVHEGMVEVFDLWGRRVLGQSFNNNVFLLKLDGIPAGTYSFRLVTQTGEVAVGRMVIAGL
jgi:hypothetical protein